MTAAEHIRRFGRTLDVHRITPGSPYTLAGCVTLCRDCHKARPSGCHRPHCYLPSPACLVRVRLDIEGEAADRLKEMARGMRLSLASMMRVVAELFAGKNGPPTLAAVRAEADRRRGPPPVPPTKKPRGRPRKPHGGG